MMTTLLKALSDDRIWRQTSATAMTKRPTMVVADVRQRQTRGDGSRVLAVAMMKAEGNSGGSEQV